MAPEGENYSSGRRSKVVKKGTEDYLNGIPGNLSLREVQKIVLTSTAHVLRRALLI